MTTGVLSQGATAAEALAANTSAMNALFAALKDAGIADKDVQTSNFMVQPRYNFQDNKAPELVGYDVSNNVTVTVRKIGDLGALLDKVVQAGSNQINGIGFEVSEPDAALDEARKLATADATRKAKIYAEAMGVSLGARHVDQRRRQLPAAHAHGARQGDDGGRSRSTRAGGRGRADALRST